jgi:peptide/nickel transport system substrate-binding protein
MSTWNGSCVNAPEGAISTCLSLITTLGAPSIRAQTSQQTQRFIAEADLEILDPIWTTAYITRNHGYLVYISLSSTRRPS